MSASCTSRVRFEVRTTIGRTAAWIVPSSGTVTGQSESISSRNASNSSSARSTSSIRRTGGGPAVDADRLEQRSPQEEPLVVQLGLDAVGAAPASCPLGLGGAQVDELAGVVPLVDAPGRRRCPRSTAGASAPAGDAGQGVGDLGLADAGLALEQQRAAQAEGEEHRGGEALVGQVAVGVERGGDLTGRRRTVRSRALGRGERLGQRRVVDDLGAEDVVDARRQVVGDLDVEGADVVVELLGPRRPDDGRGDVVVPQHPRQRQLGQRAPSSSASGTSSCTRSSSGVLQDERQRCRSGVAVGRPRSVGRRLRPAGTSRSARPAAAATTRSGDTPSSRHVGTTSPSMTRHTIEYCGWFETNGTRSSTASAWPARIWSAVHSDTPRYSDLALSDEVGERDHRLLERRLGVEAVRLVEVDVVGAEPLQRGVAALHDVLARQPPVVGAGPGRPVHLGEELDALAPLPASARPSTDSARVSAYTSAVSNVVMPRSSAACTQAVAASSSIWPPWVIQLPYERALTLRPLSPRYRCSMWFLQLVAEEDVLDLGVVVHRVHARAHGRGPSACSRRTAPRCAPSGWCSPTARRCGWPWPPGSPGRGRGSTASRRGRTGCRWRSGPRRPRRRRG